jgi:hypothetical protein
MVGYFNWFYSYWVETFRERQFELLIEGLLATYVVISLPIILTLPGLTS